jgi:type I restriction enzyme R subunit
MAMHNEVQFEKELCEYLEAHGWLYSPDDALYDRARALVPSDVRAWLEETQPEELAKRVKPSLSPQAQEKAWQGVLDRLASVLDKGEPGGGCLHVLRTGFKDTPASFAMMQKRPETDALASVNARYAANRLRVMRQVHYSTKNANSIDLVLFCNGVPVATVELKTDFTQSVNDAKKQYQFDRNPAGEPLLGFGTRALVHFAVSNDEVWMTTQLAGPKTSFLPFNRGNDGHAGNGLDEHGGSPTTYLWRDVWQRHAWLDILGKFIHFEAKKNTDPVTGRVSTTRSLIFPRFHQWDAVTRLVADTRASGPGERYLVQHSAGSGKTRTIAWTAHRLATLHDASGAKVFDTVVVVTDRKVLDDQLQEAVKQIESKTGVVATISTKESASKGFGAKSNYLTAALASGKLIVVVTLQTFPYVLEAIKNDRALKGRRFAVIADEAHSSQTGLAASKLKQVLTDAEASELDDGGEVDVETVLLAEASAKAETTNISFYAFTATPKSKTLELFGTPDVVTGLPRPFHLYTMRQAIEERFILDVLANYSTYSTAYMLAQNVQAGEMRPLRRTDEATGELVDEAAATKGLVKWVKLHPTNIAQKVQIIVEHFEANVTHLLGGQAKAMVVTDSRKAAVSFKLAIDDYIARHSLPEVTSLVAFSGEVQFGADDPEPPSLTEKYTEASMNPGAGDLRKAFDTPQYRVMIVANKFQTGFDQNKLCAMYVDKRLDGVAAVQTLSRLNRYVPGKTTMVLDFANSADDILAAFKPFYEEASIAATTDPNLIHDLGNKLDVSGLYTPEEVDAVASVVVGQLGNNALAGAIGPVTQRFAAALAEAKASGDKARHDELELFRKDVSTYVRLYDFLSQIVDFGDTDVEKHAIFFRVLATQIRGERTAPEVDLSDVALASIKQKATGKHALDLGAGEAVPLPPSFGAAGSRPAHDPRLALLTEIIARINEQFAGEDFRADQITTWTESLVAALRTDTDVVEQAAVNNQEQFLASPTLRDAVTLAVVETDQAHGRMTKLFHDRDGVEATLVDTLGKLVYFELHTSDAYRPDVGFRTEPDPSGVQVSAESARRRVRHEVRE